MVRRRPKKQRQSRAAARPFNRKDGKLKRWDKPSDIPLDEEDQFHASRDRIPLDEDNSDDDEDNGDEEVFSLQGMPENEDEDDGEDVNADHIDKDEEQKSRENEKASPKKKPLSKVKAGKRSAQSSSEEEELAEEDETWGRKKSAYYSSNAAEIGSSDGEANEMEEQEARRLQRKARASMMDHDFGFDDPIQVEIDQGIDHVLVEESPPVHTLPQDKISLIRHLEKTSPETLALARDWEDTVLNLRKCKERVDRFKAADADDLLQGMIHLQYQTLLTYATTLAFYLHLRASEKYTRNPALLQTHPVFSRLLTLKQSLSTLENLDLTLSDSEADDEDINIESLDGLDKPRRFEKMTGITADELQELLKEAALPLEKPKRSVQFAEPPPKKKRKTVKSVEKQDSTFDDMAPKLPPLKLPSSSRPHVNGDFIDSWGDATSLQFADAADKMARKKSLRFHTSKIESASMRRQGARNRAMGGDDDLPYKERRKEKDDRLAKEAQQRGRVQGGDDLGDVDQELTKKDLQLDSDEESGTDDAREGYYSLVKQTARARKEKKKAEYEALKSAQRAPDDDDPEASGQRSLTRAMLKNKGLAPHRSKDVRNPRVKKRKKFEKAKKKVASQKAVYKGGIGDVGKYGGEQSGISKVAKGIRLG